MRHIRHKAKPLWLSALVALAVFSGCALPPKEPKVLAPLFSTLKIERVALLPVVFLDHALDRYYEHRIGEEIIWHSRKVLQGKGYEVVLAYNPKKWTFVNPYRLEETDPEKLAELTPEGSDALLVIWVDNFLDSGGGNGGGLDGDLFFRSADPLELYATASLISTAERREVWRDEGYGRGFNLPSPGMELFLPPSSLADSLFTTLPTSAGP